MTSRASGRPRRTRIYGANYDIGQSLYKSAIDDLDRKQYGRSDRSEHTPVSVHVPSFTSDDFDLDLQKSRARAHRAITEEPLLFDSRGAKVTRGFPLSSTFGDDDLGEDVKASLDRIRSSRQQKLPSLLNDLKLDAEDGLESSLRTRSRAQASNSAVESASVISRVKKTTFSDVVDTSESSASLRAKATKARLDDLESDIIDRSEKQVQRERRAANLKKILADNDIEEVKSTKKVTF